jgi:hypothetical protein
MQQRVITIVLSIALGLCALTLVSGMAAWRLPDHEQGYSPSQPIAYSHRLHAGELRIDCRFCHWAAKEGRFAGIPSSDICMKCHKHVTASFDVISEERKQADEKKRTPQQIISPELKLLYDSLGLDDELKPAQGRKPKPIEWVRVHNLPDFACFDHSAHVAVGVTCQHCHGPVESMERMRQVESLTMGWCVNCHREANETGVNGKPVDAATSCSICHH